MSELIISVDRSEVRAGKLGELKAAIDGLAAFVESHEPRPIAYNVYLNEEAGRMTVVQVHPDSASMEYHLDVAAPAFAGFAELIRLTTQDVYGKPSDELLARLRRKVALLGNATIAVHERRGGFARFATR